jgi:hypothetical protein
MKENIRGLGILVFIITICYASAITKLTDLMMEESHIIYYNLVMVSMLTSSVVDQGIESGRIS